VDKRNSSAPHNTKFLPDARAHHYFFDRAANSPCGSSEPVVRQRRHRMEMTQRLNVLMTLLSVGFIAAIALGML
jgi:hypothetical protein